MEAAFSDCLWPCSLAITSTGRMGLWFCVFLCLGAPKGSPAVVLILKHDSRRGDGLKSHTTDWEKPGMEPATPGLQDSVQIAELKDPI